MYTIKALGPEDPDLMLESLHILNNESTEEPGGRNPKLKP